MGKSFSGFAASTVIAYVCAWLASFPASAANMLPDFAPDSGTAWVSRGQDFLAPASGPGPITADPKRPRITNDDLRDAGRQPLRAIADLTSPILQPWAREQMRQRNERVLAGKPGFSQQASCWPAGTPAFLTYAVQPVYFVQSQKEVLMIWQADHQIRRVYMNVPHSPNPKPSWFGESVGHYEGDTLVIDTIASDTRTFIDQFDTPHTERLHTVERYHMTNGGKTLEVNLHVEDPGAFTTPWDAMQRYKRVEPGVADVTDPFNPLSATSRAGPILEASCAENPNSLLGAEGALPIPQTKEPDF
jgi:hypothetical protein